MAKKKGQDAPRPQASRREHGAAWFSVRLGDLPGRDGSEIIGIMSLALADAGFASQLSDQTIAWRHQLSVLKRCAEAMVSENPASAYWTLALEYEIPRRGKRIDAVILTPSIVIVVEFKIWATSYERADIWQVQDYALDLRDFHEESARVPIRSVLVATNAPESRTIADDEEILAVRCSNADTLAGILAQLALTESSADSRTIDSQSWLNSGYRPTPTIVEAARRVFAGHNVRELAHAYADNLSRTTEAIARVIEYAKTNGRRVVCFVTGVPGSGKTLAGLTAMQDARSLQLGAGASAFMSGNGPLVRVLREALIRDWVVQGKKRRLEKGKTELLIQNVHHFLELYGVRQPGATPPDHVVAFDEAQRAWHEAKLSKRHKGINKSEPGLVLDIMTRPENWSVVVALVGGGQEIHDGEAGLEEWGYAIRQASHSWEIVVSPDVLHGGASVAGHRLFSQTNDYEGRVQTDPAMHLAVSVRSPKAQSIAEWVNAVISMDAVAARDALNSVQGFRLVTTRNLEDAKAWLRQSATGTLRAGLLACSGALRLRPYGLEIDANFHRKFPIERWFLDNRDDFRSSNSLEVAMTEFECQGLELDYVGLCWGDDFTVAENGRDWKCQRLYRARWTKVRDARRRYLLNKYRVLMTRAREGMVIWIPQGDSLDPTRPPGPLDRTYSFLRNAGVTELGFR
jgi:Uncharacterized conserved protein (DUF2075)